MVGWPGGMGVTYRALDGLRVVELGDGSASMAGRVLADLGAEVVVVEPPGGLPERRQPPLVATPGGRMGAGFAYYNAGKASVTLDGAHPDGARLLDRLLDGAVAVLAGPGADRSRAAARPALVWVDLTGFGTTGPRADWRAPDPVVFAAGGLLSISGLPDQPVVAPGRPAYDVAGLHAAAALLVALWERRRSGRGQRVDVSAQECLAMLENVVTFFSGEGWVVPRLGSQHVAAVPGRIYRCADGHVHLYVTPTSRPHWQAFVDWLGRPEPLAGPEWEDGAYRRAHADVVDQVVSDFVAGMPREQIYREAQARHLPCAPVQTPAEFLSDGQSQARGFVRPEGFPRPGFRTSAGDSPFAWAPAAGADNARLLGLDAAELDRLAACGVV